MEEQIEVFTQLKQAPLAQHVEATPLRSQDENYGDVYVSRHGVVYGGVAAVQSTPVYGSVA